MSDAELHHQEIPLDALAETVMRAVALPTHQLPLLADGGAVLAGVAPVPLLREVAVRARRAHGERIRGAVLLDSRSRGALVTQVHLEGGGVQVLVLGWGHLVECPGEGDSEQL